MPMQRQPANGGAGASPQRWATGTPAYQQVATQPTGPQQQGLHRDAAAPNKVKGTGGYA